MKTCVVVGGGIVGMLSALLAAERYDDVWLIEKGRDFGGLLGSFERNGAIYDYGTHVPARTGIEDLDRMLYGDPAATAASFHLLPYLRSENFFGGRWNETSPLIDARTLAPTDYARGVVELLQAPGPRADETNLFQYLKDSFGSVFTELIYRPVIGKLLGAEIETLHREVLRIFGLQRLIALTPETTRDLKTIRRFDNSLGFHSYTEGSPPLPYQYPKGNNGIGWWAHELLNRLRRTGVKLVSESEVRSIRSSNGIAKSVVLGNGKELPCTRLIWTIPPALAMRAAGMELRGKPPRFRTHTLCHFRFRDPLLKSLPQYLLCWAPEYLSYRITLYPNISPDRAASGCVNLTVEVLGNSDASQRTAEIERRVRDELIEMKIVAADNPVLDTFSQYLGNSFPVFTEDLPIVARAQSDQLVAEFRNLTLFGRGAGPSFFINDLLIQAHERMRSLND